MKKYTPEKELLKRYADILVRFALGSGKGIKKGDVVYVTVPEIARPLAIEIYRSILEVGGYPFMNYQLSSDDSFKIQKEFFEKSSASVLKKAPLKTLLSTVDDVDHVLSILAPTDVNELSSIDPKIVMNRQKVTEPFRKAYFKKEQEGKLTWTLALYGTEALAHEAGLSLKAYWQQIIKACFLDKEDSLSIWKDVSGEIKKTISWLDSLTIQKIHIQGEDADLIVGIGSNRKWLGARGANIPSFEIFTSPDWRMTEGWIRLNQPLYRNGVITKDIYLEFKKGKVVSFDASENKESLAAMLAVKNANKLGEVSMTDKRHSRITSFMAHTLYDENMGGSYGNSHIALGMAYKDAFFGKSKPKTEKDWDTIGFNDSLVHTDVITTSPRTITAYCKNGKSIIIYKDGMFTRNEQ